MKKNNLSIHFYFLSWSYDSFIEMFEFPFLTKRIQRNKFESKYVFWLQINNLSTWMCSNCIQFKPWKEIQGKIEWIPQDLWIQGLCIGKIWTVFCDIDKPSHLSHCSISERFFVTAHKSSSFSKTEFSEHFYWGEKFNFTFHFLSRSKSET